MSATNAPFGLRPAFHPSGLDRAQALANGIVSGYGSDILKGQPVVVAYRTTGLPLRHTRPVRALPTSTTIP
jgi:hypothetical protein